MSYNKHHNLAPGSDSESWQIADDERPMALCIQQRRSAWVFPYHRFAWAEGHNSEVRVAFATHIVTLSGHGLSALLTALINHSVVRIIEPTEAEAQFATGRGITSVTVSLIR
jgi:hypothetical protein